MEEEMTDREASEAKQKQIHYGLFLGDVVRYYAAAENPNEVQLTPLVFITQEYDS